MHRINFKKLKIIYHVIDQPRIRTHHLDDTCIFVVLFILKKYAWKPIMNALKEREDSIEESLRAADRAKEEMKELKLDNEKLLREAKDERDAILREARKIKDKID